ncbi:MAG: sigma-54 dependent transcriptional regulator [Desulfobacteraceae bacterium]|nr:sigma-54 dependent transcriptional regulator [Desulfobacteraceae bacterium]
MAKTYRVLIVDDELFVRSSLSRLVERQGFETLQAETGQDGLEKALVERPEIIFLDYRLPDTDGLEVLKKIKKENQDALVIFFSAHGTYKTVVEAIKEGAFDYLSKPYQNEEISLILMKAKEILKLKNEVLRLRARSEKLYNVDEVIVKSPQMRQAIELAVSMGRQGDSAVLIEGDTGVGKEVMAILIHSNSARADGQFIAVNCGAISKGLIESELFGYERGAFTGALSSGKPGMIELAEGGTLFLDEIGELSLNEQTKLLRVLETRKYFRVGGVKERTADIRVISATNRSLEQEVQEGRFRMDLYYRINVVKIRVPPLSERKDDILPLALHFAAKFNAKFNKKVKSISAEARKALLAHKWQGNVRELKNMVERAVLLCAGDELDLRSLGLDAGSHVSEKKMVIELLAGETDLESINRAIIEKALHLSDNNVSKAAGLLGLKRGALRYRLQKYGISFVE